MNHTFVIEWVGPFNNIDSLKDWENKNNQTFEYKFYIVTGKLKGRRGITKYCGITDNRKGYLYCRFYDKNHKVHRLERNRNIWIGSVTNREACTRKDIELCETMIISYWQPEENTKKKSYYPSEPVVLINRWFDTILKVRYNKIYPAQELSDVILYDECNGGVFGTKRLKQLIKID